MTRIFLSAGEPSGVAIGATLMRTLKRRLGEVEFVGLGGAAMIEEGMHILYDPARTAAMWLFGNLKRIPAHRRALRACVAEWEENRPDLVVTIDYQAFHLFIGTRARALGIPVLHFVSSQFWARRYYTLEPMRRAYSHVLCIHEFEKRYYDEAGIPATFVGHPLFERLAERELDAACIDRLRSLAAPRLGLLPGSRQVEIRASLPLMLDAARRLDPVPRLLVSCGREDSREFIRKRVADSGLEAEVVDLGSGEILRSADLAIITSGSASMEAVFYGCPAIVVYRLSPISYFMARPQLVCAIAQPNVVARREIMPEFLLPFPDARGVVAAAQHLLTDGAAAAEQRRAFAEIRTRLLEGPKPSEAAADVALRMLERRA